jgi:plastocyanin
MQALRRDIGWKARVALGGAIAAAAVLLLVSLGDGSSASARGGAAATASKSVTVNLEHLKFVPHTLNIAKGTRVVFFNNSPHTKHTATKKGSFNTGIIKPGFSAAVKFTAAGTYSYRCTIHPEMRGKIIVG